MSTAPCLYVSSLWILSFIKQPWKGKEKVEVCDWLNLESFLSIFPQFPSSKPYTEERQRRRLGHLVSTVMFNWSCLFLIAQNEGLYSLGTWLQCDTPWNVAAECPSAPCYHYLHSGPQSNWLSNNRIFGYWMSTFEICGTTKFSSAGQVQEESVPH